MSSPYNGPTIGTATKLITLFLVFIELMILRTNLAFLDAFRR
jgi:hypothetical protein